MAAIPSLKWTRAKSVACNVEARDDDLILISRAAKGNRAVVSVHRNAMGISDQRFEARIPLSSTNEETLCFPSIPG